ncbi:MAG: ATP-binding protein, partial [Microcoleus sp.]
LQNDGLISFDFNSGYWQCDIAQVKALALTDDVVEFMAIQLQKLPVNTQEVLKFAACIGNEFDLATLAIVHEKSQAETAADLWKALQEGLVIPITEVYKFFHDSESVAVAQASDLSVPYKFLHDRVQQAAYSLIPESQKQSTHLEIGRLLLRNTPEAEREDKIFDIVNQLNIGKELMTYQTERDELAQLNLIAGRKAKASTAYAAAQKYLTVGLELLAADSWESQYALTLALYEAAAEAAYLNGHFDEMDKLVDSVLQTAKILLDKVKVYSVKIQGTVAQGNLKKAIKIGLQVSELLGVILPEEPSQLDIQRGLEETASLLEGQEIEDLINLPEMTDPQKLAAIDILTSIASAAFIAAPEVFLLIALSEVNLSIKYGNATYSAYGYVAYAALLRATFENIESGYKLGKLALSLVERLNAKNVKAKVLLSFGGHLIHWKDHLRESIPVLIEGYQSGVETGDFEYAGYSAAYVCECSYLSGHELTGLEQQITIYSKAINQIGQEGPFNWTAIFWQVVLNLLGKAEDPIRLMGDAYNEEQALPRAIKVNNRIELLFIYSNQLILCYLFGEVQQAVNNATLAKQYLEGLAGMPVVSAIYLYESLAYLCLFVEASDAEKEALLNRVNANQEKMLQWADHAPMNYLHKFYLVEAERYRVLGENMEAMEMYDRAIKLAQENEYINEEALANELAAKFYLDWGKEKIAQVYLTDAYYAYARWGAKAKIDDLEKRYPQLLAPIFQQKRSLKTGETIAQMMITGTVASTSSGVSEILDLATVIKASQSLSGEINLDKLLSTLMQVMIENAGAETGAMILIERDSLFVDAQCAIGKSYNLHSTPVVDSQEIPIAIINYVSRTQETLVINDATTEATFAADSYIIQHQPKSVLCLPIQHQGKPIAILYLENNLVTNAFTPDRLAVLTILAAQAAISIENAQLYANLETKVEERTQELSQALNNLQSTQEELIQSEKMAALGQLVAGVAHEINTPLGAICSSVGYISDFLNQNLNQLPSFFQSLSPQRQQQFIEMLERSQQNTTTVSGRERRQLRKAIVSQLQAQGMTEADSVANLLLDLGICDRLEPFISIFQDAECDNFLKTVRQFVRLQESTRDIKTASERAAKIVFALKTYARFNQTGETIEANIIDGVEVVLTLYQNQLKQGVEVIRKYQDLPRIRCYFDELNQVWTNLIHNGLQAMNNRGILTIEAREQNGSILVSVTDSGEGIPEEIKPKIFQPFFTTKPPGEGSGLGLDIVRRIVEKHRGIIEFESIPGQTTFTVSLPINS